MTDWGGEPTEAPKAKKKVEPAPKPDWGGEVSAPPPPPPISDISQVDALLSSLGQGGSFGFGDELMARVESMIADTNYRDNWLRKQEELRRERIAWPKTFMAGEMAGNIGASFVPGIGWVGRGSKALQALNATSKLGQAAKFLGQAAVTGAKMGAVQGMGQSEYKYLPDQEGGAVQGGLNALADVLQHGAEGAIGGTIGAPLGLGAGKVAGKVLSPIGKGLQAGLKWSSPVVAPLLFRLKPEIAREIVKNPELYRGALKSKQKDVAQKVVDSVNKISKGADALDMQARALLTDKQALSANEAIYKLKNTMKSMNAITEGETDKITYYREVTKKVKDPETGEMVDKIKKVVVSPQQKKLNPEWEVQTMIEKVPRVNGPGAASHKEVQTMIKNIAGDKGYLTETETKQVMDAVEGMISRENMGSDVNNALKVFKGKINESLKPNTEYQKTQQALIKETANLQKFKNDLGLPRNKASGIIVDGKYQAPGRYDIKQPVLGKLNKIDKNELAQEALKKLQSDYGTEDFLAMARRAVNEPYVNVREPSFFSMGGAGLGVAGFPFGWAGVARDMYGPKIGRTLMTMGAPEVSNLGGRAGTIGMSGAMFNPIWSPYYLGGPGQTAEEYRNQLERGQ